MRHPRGRVILAWFAGMLLLAVLAPRLLLARADTADFPAPMSAAAAQSHVAAAQRAEQQQRMAAARSLGAVSPNMLPRVQTLFVSQSGHHISDRAGFLTFWRERGAVEIFGYPLSEERVENGRLVQYFERARLEYHPEAPDAPVQIALLGRDVTAGRVFEPGDPSTAERFFPETGHSLGGAFLTFWHKRGGLPVFGYPISEPIDEVSTLDGQTYTVQYFERARFEYHPDALGAFYRQEASWRGIRLAALHEVELGDLGRQAMQQQNVSAAPAPQLSGAPEWSRALWSRRVDVNLSTQQLTAYEGDLPVYTAPIATGKDGFNTPTGSFAIYAQYPIQTMVGDTGGETWYVPDIPWVQYIVGGVAFHGTYWHDQWGTGARMSHGCVNLNIDDAEWLYNWAGVGTPVEIHY